MKLEGAVAVVIGGASGIGRAYCEALLKNGAKVAIGDIQVEEGENMAQTLSGISGPDCVHFRKCNGISGDDVRALCMDAKSRWGCINIIISHIGIMEEVKWQKMIDINVGSAFLAFEVAEEMFGKVNGGPGGALVITSSRAGLVPNPAAPRYAATKAALVQFARSLMHPLSFGEHGIRVMTICPAITKTNFIHVKEEAVGSTWKLFSSVLNMRSSNQSFVSVDWVANALIEMLKDDEKYAGSSARVEAPIPEYCHLGEWALPEASKQFLQKTEGEGLP